MASIAAAGSSARSEKSFLRQYYDDNRRVLRFTAVTVVSFVLLEVLSYFYGGFTWLAEVMLMLSEVALVSTFVFSLGVTLLKSFFRGFYEGRELGIWTVLVNLGIFISLLVALGMEQAFPPWRRWMTITISVAFYGVFVVSAVVGTIIAIVMVRDRL